MAEVFLARAAGPMGFAKTCVVKRILPQFNDDQHFIQMFLNEARLAAEMNHPNLVQIFDFGEANGQYYLAMEYIDGPNLRVLNIHTRRQQGPMQLPLAARIISLASDGLHYAHELHNERGEFLNLVHRDVSPDNLLVSRNGAVKVVDFGIAKASSEPHLTNAGMIKGKLAYMPPEQLSRERLDRRADIYSLGIVFYELVTGVMPFDTSSEVTIMQAILSPLPLERPSNRRPDCPPFLEAIMCKCLEKNRDNRYPTAAALQADLEKFIRGTGKSVGTREVAQLVNSVFRPHAESKATRAVTPGLDATTPTPRLVDTKEVNELIESAFIDEDVAAREPDRPFLGGSDEKAPLELGYPLPETKAAIERPSLIHTALHKSRTPLVGALVLSLVVLAGAIVFALKTSSPRVIEENQGIHSAKIDFDAGERVDAENDPPPIAVVPTAEEGVALSFDAGSEVAPQNPISPNTKMGRLELRIRPYATVYLDNRILGDTPLAPLDLPLGKHSLRLVNPALSKDIELFIVIKPGLNVVKQNLKE